MPKASRAPLLLAYGAATRLAAPFAPNLLRARARAGKEDLERLDERLGRPGKGRPEGRLVWLHGASVGESLAALPVIEALLVEQSDLSVLVTTQTRTAAKLLAERLPDRALHQYVPVDTPAAVRRFLDHWRPDLGIWLESELWPNLVAGAARRDLPLVLLNARFSDRSLKNWGRAPTSIRVLIGAFDEVLAVDQATADALSRHGARAVSAPGNLKRAAPPLGADNGTLTAFAEALDGRPVWLAASTHDGEDEAALLAHERLALSLPGLLTVILPRHPERGAAIEKLVVARGLVVARRGTGALPERQTQVYIADTLGEMGLFCRLASAVFVGGSLVPKGGQNPLEPVRLGRPVLFGPHTENFTSLADEIIAAGAGLRVTSPEDLAVRLAGWLGVEEELGRAVQKARGFSAGGEAILDASLAAVRRHLPATTGKEA